MRNFLRLINQKRISLLALIVSDLVFFMVSFLCAYLVRNAIGDGIQPLEIYLTAMPVSFFILVVVFYFFGLYEQRIRINGMSEVYTATKAVLMTAVLLMAGSFLYKYDYSRGFVVVFIGSALVFLNVGRVFVRVLRKWFIKRGKGVVNILIIGAGKPGKKLAEQIEKYKDFGYQIVGFLDDNVNREKAGVPILGSVDDLISHIKMHDAKVVYVADPAMPYEKMLELMVDCEHLEVKFKLVSNLYEILAGKIDINEIEGIPTIDIRPKKALWWYRFVKRVFDIIFSIIGLVLLLPIWLLIVILIRMDSSGKALFKQKRVGMNGGTFKMYKFRTMKNDSKLYEEAPRNAGDERVTKLGKFLRKTSLDELPQLINILKGEMSLVGPRPEMPFIVEKYSKWQKKRLEVKPGLTGLWQILGRKDLPLHENIEYDFYYIQNQSLLLDIVILIKTVQAVITGKGAY
jgi:exopolysaccharide biosynthesis polyprenyl glycosylphosphotransferase